MGKLFNSLILSALVTISLLLFDKTGNAISPILELFLRPPTNAGSFLWDLLTSSIGAVTLGSAAAIFIGTYVVRLDWLVRAGMFSIIVGWVASPMIDLWNFISAKLVLGNDCINASLCSRLNETALSVGGSLGNVIAGLIVGPMLVYVIWASAEYVWGGDR